MALRYTIKSNKKTLIPSFVCLCILFATVLVGYIFHTVYQQNHIDKFKNLVTHQTYLLQNQIENDLQFMGSMANFLEASSNANWQNFELFAQPIIQNSKGLIALQLQQRVSSSHINQFTQDHQFLGKPITPYTLDNGRVLSFNDVKEDQTLFITTKVYPINKENLSVIGFYSLGDRTRLILNNISHSRKANISDRVRLLQDKHSFISQLKTPLNTQNNLEQIIPDNIRLASPKRGMLIYYPVFQHNEMTAVVIGVVDVTIYIKTLITQALENHHSAIQIIDTGFGANDSPVLYQSPSWKNTDGVEITTQISYPNRSWLLHFKQCTDFNMNEYWILGAIFVVGLVIALLASLVTYQQLSQNQRLQCALTERTKELEFLVNHDSLTRLLNRRAFRLTLPLWIESKQFTLVSFDIDKFKSINDTYGHIAGDEALIHVTKIVQGLLQKHEQLYRLGGDEFAILMPETDTSEIYEVLNRVRSAVEYSPLIYQGAKIYCTLSIGAVVHSNQDAEALIYQSDLQMYKSKQHGRNRISITY
ncbi:diguanylate cyclase [Photobacterium damselae subsp. damselae]|uniref:sensor domain-containing diguanylate cyclase n=1 Tax=Photobacterium damselae TaxID=38293 RepID=UPI0021FAD26C|nr:sensor domain-containing diguanylate cyclase [Photobacterium damselae]BDR36604.1 diguanylate cyclase [Photobacterium damselae subsp. damselae]